LTAETKRITLASRFRCRSAINSSREMQVAKRKKAKKGKKK
jgi:hypothetical protein